MIRLSVLLMLLPTLAWAQTTGGQDARAMAIIGNCIYQSTVQIDEKQALQRTLDQERAYWSEYVKGLGKGDEK